MSHSHHPHPHGHPPDHHHEHEHDLVTIKVGQVTKRVPRGVYTVVQIKELGGVPLGDALDVNKDGQIVPIPDAGSYDIRCDTTFFVCVRTGVSS